MLMDAKATTRAKMIKAIVAPDSLFLDEGKMLLNDEFGKDYAVYFQIDDRFYVFWFRFIFRYDYMLQIGAYEMLRKLVERDYAVFAGKALERYYLQKFAESGVWTRLGSWWDRKGTNEIDLVAENELTNQLEVYEVKIDAHRYRATQLAQKVEAFRAALGLNPARQLTVGALSLAEM